MIVKLKIFKFKKMLNISQITGYKIIHTDDMVILADKAIAKVRTKKTGGAGYQYTFSFFHLKNKLEVDLR
jgi:hypothetical protein